MLKVVWNIVKYVIGSIFSIFRPLKRLICQRRKSSESDGLELTSIGTGGLILETPQAYPQDGEGGEIDMESWDMWDIQSQSVPGYKPSQTVGHPSQQFAHSNSQGHKGEAQMNGFSQKSPPGYPGNKKDAQNVQIDPEINFFEDMTPEVKRQRKILIRKKESSQPSCASLSNRLTVLSDVPFSNSELEAWEEQANAWDTEVASDDLIWQAEEAIKENKRKERMEHHHVEQQKKKQKKAEMRGMKSGSLLATKIS